MPPPALSPGDAALVPAPTALAPESARGMGFALLAHPSVQAIRFLTKLALPWFFSTEEFGEASLASLIVFGLQHVAVFGLDEALVSTRDVSGGLWRAMRRFQDRLGLALALGLVALGLALQLLPGEALLGQLLVALAPALWIANRGTLPTWLLVRERRFRDVFLVDIASIASFSVVTIAAAQAGLGAWSLILGWSANAVAALVVATLCARDLVPRGADGAGDWRAVRRAGAHLSGAACIAYVGERIDGFLIGFLIGRRALGVFEAGQNLAGILLGWGQNVADRLLYPTLAAHERAHGLGAAWLRAIRIAVLYVVPAHVVLALCAEPLVTVAFPERWHAAGPICRLLALAAAARCLDLLASTALKAGGHQPDVLRLSYVRLILVTGALVLSLDHGLRAVVAAVLAARVTCAALALTLASLRLELARHRADARLGRALACLALWTAATVPLAAWLLHEERGLHALVQLGSIAALALATWSLARITCDAHDARVELGALRARIPPAWTLGGGA